MPEVTLSASRGLPADQESRGVVRAAAEVLVALGAAELSVVRLTGARPTAALLGTAAPGTPPDLLLVDDLVLTSAGVREGAPLRVEVVPTAAARSVVLEPDPLLQTVPLLLLREALVGKAVAAGEEVSLLLRGPGRAGEAARLRNLLGYLASTARVRVRSAEPAGPVLCGAGTSVTWADASAPDASAPDLAGRDAGPADSGSGGGGSGDGAADPAAGAGTGADAAVRAEVLPGLEAQAAQLRERLDLGLAHPELLARLGSAPSMGVLLSGPEGVGKAAAVAAVAAGLSQPLRRADGRTLAALAPEAATAALTSLLAEPGVVVLERVEALAPREGPGPLLPALLDLLRAAVQRGRTAVVCLTARPEDVAPALRAPGLLEHELVVPLPDRAQRRRLLDVLVRDVPLAADVALDDVAARTPGFVAADLRSLLRAAGLHAAGRQRGADDPRVAAADLDAALGEVRASSAEGALEPSGLTLDDVGDMAEVKAALTEAVLWPLRYPDTFATLGVDPPRGVLLYGPPGCGKTFLVRALAGSGEATVLTVKGAELLSKWVGESERAVRELFRRARESAPALVFLDEVDALAPVRGGGNDGGTTDRVVAALLTELDGVEALRDVVVVGATNRPDRIDPALLRPGRLERLVSVPPPDAAARTEILRAASRRVPLADDVDLVALGERTDGYSAADCAALVREAALTAMRSSLSAATVTAADLETALGVVRPSLDPAQVAALARYAEERASR